MRTLFGLFGSREEGPGKKGGGPAILAQKVGEVGVLAIQPHVREEDVPELMAEARALLAGGCRSLVIDFTRTDAYIGDDLGVLFPISREYQAAGGRMVLAGLHGQLRAFFEGVRVLPLFDSYDTLEAALDSFREAGAPGPT